MWCVRNGSVEALRVLIDAGCDMVQLKPPIRPQRAFTVLALSRIV